MLMLAARKRTLVVLTSLLVATCAPTLAGDLKPEEVVTRHLQSLGSTEARAAAKSRVVEGAASYKILVGGSGQLHGKAVFASEGQKTHLLLKVPATEYHGEQFVCDGEKTSVAATYADTKTYSDLADFIKGQNAPLREGLLGGVLTTAWPLLDIEGRKAKLSYEGLKKVEGRQLQVVRYRPKQSTDLDVDLYFDPETFRHVMTIYTASIAAPLGPTEVESVRQQPTRYRIEERFSDFQTADGLTLPSHYDLRFTEELHDGFTKSLEWDVTASRILNNVTLDPRNFKVK